MTSAPFWLEWLTWLFLAYFVGLNLVYLMLEPGGPDAAGRETAVRTLSTLPAYTAGLEPGVTICIPAYNEQATIAESVRSMLQIDLPRLRDRRRQ
jgi:cellulose synthase/poly-beta-1,6-N-acetylglucosamine synthase-like glycosyltransferase